MQAAGTHQAHQHGRALLSRQSCRLRRGGKKGFHPVEGAHKRPRRKGEAGPRSIHILEDGQKPLDLAGGVDPGTLLKGLGEVGEEHRLHACAQGCGHGGGQSRRIQGSQSRIGENSRLSGGNQLGQILCRKEEGPVILLQLCCSQRTIDDAAETHPELGEKLADGSRMGGIVPNHLIHPKQMGQCKQVQHLPQTLQRDKAVHACNDGSGRRHEHPLLHSVGADEVPHKLSHDRFETGFQRAGFLPAEELVGRTRIEQLRQGDFHVIQGRDGERFLGARDCSEFKFLQGGIKIRMQGAQKGIRARACQDVQKLEIRAKVTRAGA